MKEEGVNMINNTCEVCPLADIIGAIEKQKKAMLK